MSTPPLRVLVVDDTVTYRKIVSDVLSGLPGVEVAGVAANGKIAVRKLEQLRPDLMTLDLEMPEMDGLAVLRALRESTGPAPGVIMLSSFTTQGADTTVAALKLGAFDFVLKPSGPNMAENAAYLARELKTRLDAFGRAQLLRPAMKRAGSANGPPASSTAPPQAENLADRPNKFVRPRIGRPEVIAIGISTGGPQALGRMLPLLPTDLAAPVLIVQHMPPKFTASLAADLAGRCRLAVSEAVNGDAVRPGRILIAPGGRQMKIARGETGLSIRITDDPPENHCRPAVDYLFRSVAATCEGKAVGVIMTGMGNDGALGCRLLKRKGASIVAQDEATCVVYGMPKAPADEGIADVIAPLDRIADEITTLAGRAAAACR